MVDTRFDWGATRVTPRQFEKQIKYAVDQGFRFLTLSEYVKEIQINPKQKLLALTFDDGYESVYKHAFHVLEKFNLKATVFILPDFTGKLNTWDLNIGGIRFKHLKWNQIKELENAGWEIGSHSLSHLDLTRLSNGQLENEVFQSKQILEQHLEKNILSIAYPFGNVNKKVADVVLDSGYQVGVVMGHCPDNVPDQLCLPRFGVYLFDCQYTFHQKLYSINNKFYRTMQKLFDRCSDCTVLVKQGFF